MSADGGARTSEERRNDDNFLENAQGLEGTNTSENSERIQTGRVDYRGCSIYFPDSRIHGSGVRNLWNKRRGKQAECVSAPSELGVMADKFRALRITRACKTIQVATPHGSSASPGRHNARKPSVIFRPVDESGFRTPQAHAYIIARGGGVYFLGPYCARVTPWDAPCPIQAWSGTGLTHLKGRPSRVFFFLIVDP